MHHLCNSWTCRNTLSFNMATPLKKSNLLLLKSTTHLCSLCTCRSTYRDTGARGNVFRRHTNTLHYLCSTSECIVSSGSYNSLRRKDASWQLRHRLGVTSCTPPSASNAPHSTPPATTCHDTDTQLLCLKMQPCALSPAFSGCFQVEPAYAVLDPWFECLGFCRHLTIAACSRVTSVLCAG